MTAADQTTSLFASIAHTAGRLLVRLTGPAIGQREVPIITEIVAPAIEKAATGTPVMSTAGGGSIALGGGLQWVVLDMSQVTFLNSMALGMCIDFRNRAAKHKSKAAIVGANAELTGLFKIVKLEKLFTFARTVEELK